MKKFETLEWKNNELILIDQRLLPSKEIYYICKNVDDVASAIKCMVVRGAPAIGGAAAYGFAIAVLEAKKKFKSKRNLPLVEQNYFDKFLKDISMSKDMLADTRPTAVNLFWALNRMDKVFQLNTHLNTDDVVQKIIDEANKIFHEDIETNKKIGHFGAQLLDQNSKVLTHCNAGALATAGHGTALGIIRSAVEIGKSIEVFAGETRPFLQGARLTAWELIQDSIPVTLITDNMSGYLMSKNVIDAVIVGADRVTANGDVINKIGTYSLAVLAKQHQIPFYVACPWSTIDLATNSGNDVKIEERNSDEVRGFGNFFWAPKETKIFNPAFDVTPGNFVSMIVTERGNVIPTKLDRLAAL